MARELSILNVTGLGSQTATLYAGGVAVTTVTLTEEPAPSGVYTNTTNITGLAAGTYFIAATVDGTLFSRTMQWDGTAEVTQTGDAYAKTLNAAGVRAAVGMAAANLDAQLSGIAAGTVDLRGPGADSVTITWTNSTTALPVADGDVWITDANGVIVAGTLQTNTLGQATFLLTAGLSYRLWSQKDGVNSIEGQAFVAAAD